MNISTIGIQTVQTGSGIQRQSPGADTGGESNSDRVTPSAPTQPPPSPGTGQAVDKTV
jgi:hypothetical protein